MKKSAVFFMVILLPVSVLMNYSFELLFETGGGVPVVTYKDNPRIFCLQSTEQLLSFAFDSPEVTLLLVGQSNFLESLMEVRGDRVPGLKIVLLDSQAQPLVRSGLTSALSQVDAHFCGGIVLRDGVAMLPFIEQEIGGTDFWQSVQNLVGHPASCLTEEKSSPEGIPSLGKNIAKIGQYLYSLLAEAYYWCMREIF